MTATDAAAAGASATQEDAQEDLDWFARYDALVGAGDLEAMADMASFPINEVTDDATGQGIAGSCDRAKFLGQMEQVVGSAGEVEMKSTRHPVLLSRALCFVVTDASFTTEGRTSQMRYGDLLVRSTDGWKFQTMVAGGWHDHM